jgi:very-short-patch-repair endonuclease
MGKRIDLVGKKFGRWTVIKCDYSDKKRLYWLCKCDCGIVRSIAGNSLRYGGSTSCGCYKTERTSKRCRKDLVWQTFGYWSVLGFSHTKHNKAMWKCLCKCGNIGFVSTSSLTTGKSKSCGCYDTERIIERCRHDLSNKKFGSLQPLECVSSSPVKWKCRCDCGRECIVRADSLQSEKTQSCGCFRINKNKARCTKDITGLRFGRLVVVKYSHSNNRVYWECVCDCGRTHRARQNSLHNGHATSLVKERLLNLIGRGEHNFRIGRKSVDIALLECKIAIEYDSWYWHANKQNKDKNRRQWLNRRGWKVLTIKGNKRLPPKEIIKEKLDILLSSDRKNITIKLKDWGVGNTFEEIRKHVKIDT